MTETSKQKDQPILISGLAVEILKDKQNEMREKGVRMSMSALASQAIIENIKGA